MVEMDADGAGGITDGGRRRLTGMAGDGRLAPPLDPLADGAADEQRDAPDSGGSILEGLAPLRKDELTSFGGRPVSTIDANAEGAD